MYATRTRTSDRKQLARMMVPLLLLLAATVHSGFSFRTIKKQCGGSHQILMPSGVHAIEFIADHSGESMMVWQKDITPVKKGSRRMVKGIYFVITSLLQRDSGKYILYDRSGQVVYGNVLLVTERSMSITLEKSEELHFSFSVDDEHCNIYFTPQGTTYGEESLFVEKGVYQRPVPNCEWLQYIRPCGVEKDHMQSGCTGEFEIRDDEGDTVLRVSVNMEEEPVDVSHIGGGLGIFFVASGLCFCMKLCCCSKKKKRQTEDNNVEDLPAAEDHRQYDNEPARRTPVQVNQPTHPGTSYPPQPSYAPTGPLMNTPTVPVPPSYSEISAPLDAPPLYSEIDPRFELTGFASAPPLGSDSTHSDVYTSDKLNFL